jgi:hypothetical protein
MKLFLESRSSFIERFPPTSSDTFLLDNDNEMMIDAEGVLVHSVHVAWLCSLLERSAVQHRFEKKIGCAAAIGP